MTEMTCGDCRFFLVENHRDDGRIGRCKLGKLMGVFREATGACSSFSRPGDTALPTPTSAARSARQRSPAAPVQFTVSSGAVTQLLSTLEPLTFKGVLIDLLTARCALPIASVPMRWEGDVRLLPADDSLKSKDIPVEQFLAKAFAVRDNLRVM